MRRPGLDVLEQPLQLAAQEVTGGDLTESDAHRGNLPREVLGVGHRSLAQRPVLLVLHPVAVGLPVLREQDQGAAYDACSDSSRVSSVNLLL